MDGYLNYVLELMSLRRINLLNMIKYNIYMSDNKININFLLRLDLNQGQELSFKAVRNDYL